MIYIYALIDPITNEVRYIGKSIRPKERLGNQCNEKGMSHRIHWIQSLKEKGLKPDQWIIETLPDDANWQEREMFWIAYGRQQGWSLTNSTDGGDGVLNISGESKERMIKTWKGRKHKPESIEKMRQASTGVIPNAENRLKRSRSLKGRIITPEHREKLSQAKRRFSDEELDRIKELLSLGHMVKDIAKLYGVHRMTISRINMGKYPK